MTTADVDTCDLAIVGGGAGGVLTALHALALSAPGRRIVLVEPSPALAEGPAYATRRPEHLLNVPAGRMSAFAARPGDFVDALRDAFPDQDPDALAQRFVARGRYADYLRRRLDAARGASACGFEHRTDRVLALRGDAPAFRLALASGATLRAARVVLALGNAMRPLPVPGAQDAGRLVQAWDYEAVCALPPDADVLIVGSGLSMVDCVLSLAGRGHRGRLQLLSRHALMPQPHAPAGTPPAALDVQALLGLPLRARLRRIRAEAAAARRERRPWQAVMEALRPHGIALWRSLDEADQARFLRHLRRQWDVHRHRIPADVHARLRALLDAGRVQPHRGRLGRIRAQGDRWRAHLACRGGGEAWLEADVIVNATGIETRAEAMDNPLVTDLLREGRARPGPHALGLDTTVEGALVAADGRPDTALQVVGSLRMGRLWECIAVPELRVQAERAARTAFGLPETVAG